MMVIIIILIVLFALYLYNQYKANKTLWQVKKETEELRQERLEWHEKAATEWENERLQNQKQIMELVEKKNQIRESLQYERTRLEMLREQGKADVQKEIDKYKDTTTYAAEQYVNALEQKYQKIEQDYDAGIAQLNLRKQQVEDDLSKLKESLNAGIAAQQREREKIEKLDFYKLSVSASDEEDIKKLESLKLSLHQPIVLSKLIWSTYFQKQTTDMCNRILGTKPICGIYKITNIESQQCYIGQSLNCQDRWKAHCKCGCGIDASATNKLYNAMQKDGIWNFTFELLEACPREQLNEKEIYWINMYQSDKVGYNSTKGGS